MGYITFQGSMQGMPNAGGGFPASTFSTPLSLMNGNKQFGTASGVLTRKVPVAYQALSAVGDGADVPKADFLYLRSDGAILLRLTREDGAGGSVITVEPVQGLFVLECSPGRLITLVEVQGTGSIEYFASGP